MQVSLIDQTPEQIAAYVTQYCGTESQLNQSNSEINAVFEDLVHRPGIMKIDDATDETSNEVLYKVTLAFNELLLRIPTEKIVNLTIRRNCCYKRLAAIGDRFTRITLFINFDGMIGREEQERHLQRVLQTCPKLEYLRVPRCSIPPYADGIIPDSPEIKEIWWGGP